VSFFVGTGRFEDLNADVRWTSACRQLDGGNSLIFISKGNENVTNLAGTSAKQRGPKFDKKTMVHKNKNLV